MLRIVILILPLLAATIRNDNTKDGTKNAVPKG